MPAGEPVLASSSSNGQLIGNDLENSNTGSRHARKVAPTPDTAPGAAAPAQPSGLRLHSHPREPSGQRETYVPRHERPITWDICHEPRHLHPLRTRALKCGLFFLHAPAATSSSGDSAQVAIGLTA